MQDSDARVNEETLPLVSIIMLTWNRRDYVKDSLIHVFESTYPNVEVIVVHNASTDGTPDMVKEEFSQVRLICIPKNIGIEGYNIGFKNARGKYIVVLDDDSYPEKKAISKMVKRFEDNPDIGIIAFEIINPKTGVSEWHKKREDGLIPQGGGWFEFIGCGAGIRSDVLKEAGYYNDKFFLYCNELDLSIRILNKGYKIVYCPDIIAFHYTSPTHRTSGRRMFFATRNYLWITWLYFHSWDKINLMLGYLYGHGKQSIRNRVFKSFIKGVYHAVANWSDVASAKQALSKETIAILKKYIEVAGFAGILKRRMLSVWTKPIC